MLTPNQIEELFNVIEKHRIVFVASHVGEDYLTSGEKRKLTNAGIDYTKLYSPKRDFLTQQFYFGLISDAMGSDAKNLNFEELKNFLSRSNIFPLTQSQKYSVESIKNQFLGDIKGKQNQIFTDVNNIINKQTSSARAQQEEVIRQQLKEGFIANKTYNEITRSIARKTGDWSRDFSKVVEFTSHTAFNEGRVAAYELDGGEETYVYFTVFPGACSHCIRLYLTKGIGSKPKIFKVSTLRSYGNNIGRKVADWKPSLSGIHVFCRCTAHRYRKGFTWNKDKGKFERPKKIVIEGRDPIPVQIMGKTYQL